jgi:pimeloyl-ACP methyl ester carboxylesterase
VPYINRSGLRLRYDVQGEGPAILLSHGFAATSSMFAANLDVLSAKHTVVTWDLRGHGDSDYPSEPAAYTVALCVADMTALLDQVGAARAIVAGHSLGGYLSLEFQLAHPERTDALVLVDTGPGYRSDTRRTGWNEMAERYACRLELDGLAAILDGEELRADAHRDATGLVLAARNLLVQHGSHVVESLGSISVPTLVVVGEHDGAFLAGARYMTDKIPTATLEVVDGARHAPNVTHAARFNELVMTFLGRVEEVRS